MSNKRLLFLIGLTAILLPAGSALASTGGAEHESILSQLAWPWVNFIIYLGVVGYIYNKKGAPALRDWRESLKGTLERSGLELQAAERELASIRLRFSNLEEEKRVMKQQLIEEGERISLSIADSVKIEAKKIETDNSSQRVNAITRLQRELSLELVNKAVVRAEEILRGGVSADDDRRLRDEVLSAFIGGQK